MPPSVSKLPNCCWEFVLAVVQNLATDSNSLKRGESGISQWWVPVPQVYPIPSLALPGHLGCAVHKLVVPELVDGVLDQLDEGDQQAPRMRSIDDESLHQHTRDLLLEGQTTHTLSSRCAPVRSLAPVPTHLDRLRIGLHEQVQQHTAEVVGEAVRVAQLVGDRVQEQVPALVLQVHRQVLENVHVRTVHDGVHVGRQVLGPTKERGG